MKNVAAGIPASSELPARHDTAVVFTSSRLYAPYAWMAASQLAGLRSPRSHDICIASTEDIADVPSLSGCGVRRVRIEVGDLFDGFHCDHRRTLATYLRLALPAALGGDYRRILYMDSDVFIAGGDFGALLEVPLHGHAVAAVRDNIQWRTPGRRPECFRRLGLPTARFANSGVMLMDTAAWREQRVLERCLEVAAKYPPEQIGLDQDLLNIALQGDWAELSPTWNWLNTWASRFFSAMEDPNVVHFIGPSKPWSHDRGQLPLRYRRAARDFFATHLPDAPQVSGDGAKPHKNRRYLYRSLLKHLVSVRAICDYLDRFEDDLTVLS